jgi:hypothetical protein
MQQLLPTLINAGFPVIPEVVDYMPLPLNMTTKWKEAYQMTTQKIAELEGQVSELERKNLILEAKREERVYANETKANREVLADDRDRDRITVEEYKAQTERMKAANEGKSNGSE